MLRRVKGHSAPWAASPGVGISADFVRTGLETGSL